MTRREILTNILLLAVIGGFALFIYLYSKQLLPELEVSVEQTRTQTESQALPVARPDNQQYGQFGGVALFQAIIPPTPEPPPPPPPPPKTPDIHRALAAWRLIGTDPGEATIEDRSRKEDSIFVIRVSRTWPAMTDNETKMATLLSVDHLSDNPSVVFGLEGTSESKTLKLFEDLPANQGPQ